MSILRTGEVNPRPWMPKEMSEDEKSYFADLYPRDPHRAAAEAWESWAARLDTSPIISTASTGTQSVSYLDGKSEFRQAERRAAWHRARTKAYSVETLSMGTPPSHMLDDS